MKFLKNELPRPLLLRKREKEGAGYPCGRVLSTEESSPQSGEVFMFRNKFFLILLAIVIFSLLMIFLSNKNKKEANKVCFADSCFKVEIAKTSEERNKGMMFKKNLALDEGMLFVFEEETEQSFWMKNTLIPLDIIWLNKEKEAVFIEKNAQPCKEEPCPSIKPAAKAMYVLELNAGISDELGLNVGDKISF